LYEKRVLSYLLYFICVSSDEPNSSSAVPVEELIVAQSHKMFLAMCESGS
jgi:hypothetical protein